MKSGDARPDDDSCSCHGARDSLAPLDSELMRFPHCLQPIVSTVMPGDEWEAK